MKKLFVIVLVLCVLLTLSAFAADTVYVDGVGTDENCYATLFEAFDAVDDGGTVILKTDYEFKKANEGNRNTTPAKEITVTAETGKTLTFTSTFKLGGKVTFKNITIASNLSSGVDFIYCCGNDLVIDEGVETLPKGTRYLTIFLGDSTKSSSVDNTVTLKSGIWRGIYTGGNTNAAHANGNATVNIYDGATLSGGTLSLGGLTAGATVNVNATVNIYGGTVPEIKLSNAPATTYAVNLYGGTVAKISVPVTVDLTDGGTVTITNENGQTVTTVCADGYEVVKNDTTYSAQEITVEIPTTVYLDGTGATEGAYTDLISAIGALQNGGTVIVTGDTYVSGKQPVMEYKVKIVGETGKEKIILDEKDGKSIRFQCPTEIDNIVLVSNVNTDGYTSLITMGNEFIIGENVTCEQLGAYGFTIYGGAASGTVNKDSHIVVKGGTFRRIYGGNSAGTFNGNSLIEIYDATVEGVVNGKCEKSSAVFNGTSTVELYSGATVGAVTADSITIDLTNLGTVTTASVSVTPTVIVPEGKKLMSDGKVYTVDEVKTLAYVDGTGKTEGAYATLAEALADLPFGGTVVVSGNSKIGTTGTLPATSAVVITSKYGDEDYTDTAALEYDADFTLGGETIFRDIVLERTMQTSGLIFVYANGNPITFDNGVICRNYTGHQYLSVTGGAEEGTLTGDSHVTIKSGIFHNVYGANRKGTFNGNSYLDVTGGSIVNGICGGNYVGTFTGDVHFTFAGSASLLYTASNGLTGGNMGDGSTTTTFTGNIYLTLGGKCGINNNVFGGSRNKKTTTKGDVEIVIEDSAYAPYTLYAGGYLAGLDGNVRLIVNGGDFCGNVYGGTKEGTVTGDIYIEINDGKLCYNKVNHFSGASNVAGTANVYASGNTDCVFEGTGTIRMNGGSVYGDISADAITFTGGTVFGVVLSDNTVVDLSDGGTASIGVSSSVKKLIGGGKLILSPVAKLTTETLSGKTSLEINGLPLPYTYVTALAKESGAEIAYLAQDNETLVVNGNNYDIDFEGKHTAVTVTVTHKEGFTVRLRTGSDNSSTPISAVSTTATSATYSVAPGLYNAAVVVNGSDNKNFERKFIYIDGRSATYTVAVEFDKVSADGHNATSSRYASDETLDKYFDATDLEGYFQPDTPYFNKRFGTTSGIFTTNEELVEFLAQKQEKCGYMYVYEIAKSPYGYSVPLALFTLDPIPEGATLEEAAEIVGKTEGRDILMFGSGIHGDEVGGQEGAIAFIAEMAGDYGMSILDGTNIGAVIVVPRLNPDAAKDYTRGHPTMSWLGTSSLNSDFMALSYAEIAGYARAYQLFMPTLTVDGHEANVGPTYSPSQLSTDVYDVAIKSQGTLNSAEDILAVINGDRSGAEIDAANVAVDVMHTLQDRGIRAYYYMASSGIQNCVVNFGSCGSYSFLLETPGISGGDGFIERRAFVQMTCLKELINVVLESDGEMARKVAETRKALAESAQIYDGVKPVILQSEQSKADEVRFEWNNPLVGADNTVRVEDNLTFQYPYDTAVRYRTMPTAYAIAADAEGIEDVIALLDRHGVNYKLLPAGATLSLQQYSGTTSAASLSEVKEVTFANGAYLVPVDGARAYITAFLFEPDSNDDSYASFTKLKFISVDSVYRSTESYIAAKNGMAGTYVELSTGGKAVENAIVDGEVYENIYTEGDNAYVVRADDTITLNFTDGTSETYYYSDIPGDIDGDRIITVKDALMLLNAVVNGQYVENGDVNGNGKADLADVIRVVKNIAQ